MILGTEGRDQGHQGRGALLKYRGDWSVFYPLCCLSFFDLRNLITLWYLQTLLTQRGRQCSHRNLLLNQI